MSAILAGAALREEIKGIIAARKNGHDMPQDKRTSDEKAREWESHYLEWVFHGKREARDDQTDRDKFINDSYYLLTANDFADPAGFLDEFRKQDKTTGAKIVFSKFPFELRQRLEIGRFKGWLAATLVAEINEVLNKEDLPGAPKNVPPVEDSLKRLAANRMRLAEAFPEAISEPHIWDKKNLELSEQSVQVKKLLKALRAKENEAEKKPADIRDFICPKLSPAIQYALLNEDFEKTEIEAVIEEVNRLLPDKSFFIDAASNGTEAGGRAAAVAAGGGEKQIVPKEFDAAMEMDFETHHLQKGELSVMAQNRLRLQKAFPIHIAKVWDSLPVLYAWIHAQEKPLTALCLSGGGIRSATFGLGILQGLAEHDVLKHFDYLSTVSGGGYIGGWLSAWSKRSGDLEKVEEDLTKRGSDPAQPEPLELRHLREYSNYLTPKLGLTSADTWTLLGTYIRNLALNWLVFLPAIAALLAIPRIWVAVLQLNVPRGAAFGLFGAGMVFAIWAIVYAALNRPSLSDPRNAVRGTIKFLVHCLGPLFLSAFCLTAYWAWLQNERIRPEEYCVA